MGDTRLRQAATVTVTSHHKRVEDSIRLRGDPHQQSEQQISRNTLVRGAPNLAWGVGLWPADYGSWDFLASIMG